MRLILALLAVANARWGRAEIARSDWHRDQAEFAYGRSQDLLALSGRFLERSRRYA